MIEKTHEDIPARNPFLQFLVKIYLIVFIQNQSKFCVTYIKGHNSMVNGQKSVN